MGSGPFSLVAGEDCATFAFFPAAFCLDMHEYYRGVHMEQVPLPIWDCSCVGELASYIAGDGINLHVQPDESASKASVGTYAVWATITI